MYPILSNKAWLKKEYLEKGLNSIDLAIIVGCGQSTVCAALKRHNITKKIKVEEGYKYCPGCKEVKKNEDFYRNTSRASGLSDYCSKCIGQQMLSNRGKKHEYDYLYREKNIDKKRKYEKEYYHKNFDGIKIKKVLYSSKRKPITNRQQRLRRKNDENFRLLGVLRSRLKNALRGLLKHAKTMDLLGCSIFELKQHLLANAPVGFTWEDFRNGGYHVHHIKPCSSFDLTKEEDQRQCFNFSNLKILRAEDNLHLGNKVSIT
jgi:hypothetical protein